MDECISICNIRFWIFLYVEIFHKTIFTRFPIITGQSTHSERLGGLSCWISLSSPSSFTSLPTGTISSALLLCLLTWDELSTFLCLAKSTCLRDSDYPLGSCNRTSYKRDTIFILPCEIQIKQALPLYPTSCGESHALFNIDENSHQPVTSDYLLIWLPATAGLD